MGVAPANGSPVISRSWKVPAVRSTRPLAWGDRANIIGMSPQRGVHPRQAALIQGGIQHLEALEGGHRHQEVPSHVAHQAFHLPLVVALAGTPPEPVLEQVVGLEFGEGLGTFPASVSRCLSNSRGTANFVLSYGMLWGTLTRKASVVSEGVALTKQLSLWGRSKTRQWAFRSTPPMTTRASPKSHWACPGEWDRGTNISRTGDAAPGHTSW